MTKLCEYTTNLKLKSGWVFTKKGKKKENVEQ